MRRELRDRLDVRAHALLFALSTGDATDRFADDIHFKGGALLGENFGWGSVMLSYSSRPGDPLLHTHAVIANVATGVEYSLAHLPDRVEAALRTIHRLNVRGFAGGTMGCDDTCGPDTSGCTAEAIDFSALKADFETWIMQPDGGRKLIHVRSAPIPGRAVSTWRTRRPRP